MSPARRPRRPTRPLLCLLLAVAVPPLLGPAAPARSVIPPQPPARPPARTAAVVRAAAPVRAAVVVRAAAGRSATPVRPAAVVRAAVAPLAVPVRTAPVLATPPAPPAVPRSLAASSDYGALIDARVRTFDTEAAGAVAREKALAARERRLDERSTACTEAIAAHDAAEESTAEKIQDFNADAAALNARVEAHNAEPHEFRLPAQEAAAAAYDAEASALNADKDRLEGRKADLTAEKSKLAKEAGRLDSRQDRLNSDIGSYTTDVDRLAADTRRLVDGERALLQDMARELQALAADPPDATATMAAGGDAPAPPRQAASAGGGTATGGDSPSPADGTTALRDEARREGGTAENRPGTAFLTPAAVAALPASRLARLNGVSVPYDGLVRRPDGHRTAVRVAPAGTTAPADRAAFDYALEHGGSAVAVLDGERVEVDAVRTVEPAAEPDHPSRAKPSASPRRRAACLSADGRGWIRNTSVYVAHRNLTTTPKGGPGARAALAVACLARGAGGGQKAGGDITGWQDARHTARTAKAGARYPVARCHLVAKDLGGRGNPQNLVPCWQVGMNTGTPSMRTYEKQVSDERKTLAPHDAIFYLVLPHYRTRASTVPEGVSMTAVLQRAGGGVTVLFLGRNVPNDKTIGGKIVNLGN